MKILTTQLGGLLQRMASGNEEAVEETARLLAQATVGEGRVLFAAFGEMDALTSSALHGAEPFKGAVRYEPGMTIGSADRVWILARSAADEEVLALARTLAEQFVPFAALAGEKDEDGNELAELAYTYVSTGVVRGLLPGPGIERIVQPHAFAALFLYEAVKLEYDDMVLDED